jgi:hypothetical protein
MGVIKMDMVLQGNASKYTLEIAEHYLQLKFVNNIIISCWQNDDINSTNSRIHILKNEDVENPGSGNRNRQIKSSLEGLKQVTTEFSAKLRSDQKIRLTSMNLMYYFYLANSKKNLSFWNNELRPYNKICVAGIFRPFPFHPRDHIFWGNTLDLIDVFNIPYDTTLLSNTTYTEILRSEAYIAAHYYANFNPLILDFIKNKKDYLVDNAPKINEAFEINNKIITDVFMPFPKIDFEWPKYGMQNYHYDITETQFGEYWN